MTEIAVGINGQTVGAAVEERRLLCDFLREELGLTGTHIGCEHGVCGACTILFDGRPIRSCLMFAVQADGHQLETIESLSQSHELHPIQEAFWNKHGLQCGFCTPGMIMTIKAFLLDNPAPTEEDIRLALAGNICRCTGYVFIVDAVKDAAEQMRKKAGSA